MKIFDDIKIDLTDVVGFLLVVVIVTIIYFFL
jgi:hypothetical protein